MNSFQPKRPRRGDLINRLNGGRAKQLFHSSGYAQEAQGDLIGATSPETFERRRDVERQRRLVQRYRDSRIGQARNQTRPQFQPEFLKKQNVSKAQQSLPLSKRDAQRQSFNSGTPLAPQSRTAFQEPPRRDYDPYR